MSDPKVTVAVGRLSRKKKDGGYEEDIDWGEGPITGMKVGPIETVDPETEAKKKALKKLAKGKSDGGWL